MPFLPPRLLALVLLTWAASAASAIADALVVGDSLGLAPLEDQHGQARPLGSGVRVVLFAADRPASKVAEQALEGSPPELFAAGRLAYVADLSGMPDPITDLFALPALRGRPYPVLIAREAALTAVLPRRPNAATLLRVRDGRIAQVAFYTDADTLRAALADPGGDPGPR